MKKTLSLMLCCVFVATSIFTSCRQEEKTNPKLQITTENRLEIESDGGTVSFSYKITDQAADGRISATVAEECDWISSIDTETPETVTITVEPNDTEFQRKNEIILVYTFGNRTLEESIELIQYGINEDPENPDDPDNPSDEFDYEFEAKAFTGEYCGTWLTEPGKHAYVTQLSDNIDITMPNTTKYVFGLICREPEDGKNPLPETGTYTYNGEGYEYGTFFSAKYTYINGNGDIEEELEIVDGTVDFWQEGNTYGFDVRLIDSEGKKHHVTYSSKVSIDYHDYSQNPKTLSLTRDVRFIATTATASYKGMVGGKLAKIKMSFAENEHEVYYSTMNIVAYLPFNECNGELMPGTYNISASQEELTLEPGYWIKYGDMNLYGDNTCLEFRYYKYNEDTGNAGTGIAYGIVESGSMTVSGQKGAYSISFDFITEDGYSLTGTYSGDVEIDRFAISTLSGDRTVDLSNAKATIENKYNLDIKYYDSQVCAGWELIIASPEGGDCVKFQLASEILSLHDGIVAGTYRKQSSSKCDLGEFVKGFMDGTEFKGSFFFSGFDENGCPEEFAPAVDGTITIKKTEINGTENYSISFEIEDDMGNIWSGSWDGVIENLSLKNKISTLKGDRQVVFDKPTATATWYGSNTDNEMLWEVYIQSENGGDCVRLNLCTYYSGGVAGGVPSGEYTYCTDNDEPWGLEFLTGIISKTGDFENTFFFSDFDENGIPHEYAPAVKLKGRNGGSIDVTNNGDGTYHIDFILMDDCQSFWYGEYSGPIEHKEAKDKIIVGY